MRISDWSSDVCSSDLLGVLLYDADRIEQAAAVQDEKALYEAQLGVFLDPEDPAVIAQALADGVPQGWMAAACQSPTYKMAVQWRIAFQLHPEYRKLTMVWYVTPLSQIQAAGKSGHIGPFGEHPAVRWLRMPLR